MNKIIGILGGTFDPIHNGHLKIAEEILEKLSLEEIRFLPNKMPPHRTAPHASLEHRINMITLAIAKNPKFKLDLTEANRPGPSYMFDTLKMMCAENPNAIFALILGEDVFAQFNTWHRYSEILDQAHLVIVSRNSTAFPEDSWMRKIINTKGTKNLKDLSEKKSGLIYEYIIEPIPISATKIREKLIRDEVTQEIPQSVLDYLRTHQLYSKG